MNLGRDPFNQNSNRSDWEKWSTSKGGPVFSKIFRLDRTDPLSFGPKFPEILVEWIAPCDLFSLGRTWIPDFNRQWEQTPICGQDRIKLELYPLLLWIIIVSILNLCLEYPLECTLLELQAQRLSFSFQLLVQRVYFGSLRPGSFSTSVFFIFAKNIC